MTDTPDTPSVPQRPHTEYEDPHFHDDEEAGAPEDDEPAHHHPHVHRPPAKSRKLPPRPRRFDED
jgi:hypothetical protein